jgi:hypothetical protein
MQDVRKTGALSALNEEGPKTERDDIGRMSLIVCCARALTGRLDGDQPDRGDSSRGQFKP